MPLALLFLFRRLLGRQLVVNSTQFSFEFAKFIQSRQTMENVPNKLDRMTFVQGFLGDLLWRNLFIRVFIVGSLLFLLVLLFLCLITLAIFCKDKLKMKQLKQFLRLRRLITFLLVFAAILLFLFLLVLFFLFFLFLIPFFSSVQFQH